MGNGRDDEYPGIFEADKTAIKKVVNRGSQQKSVLAIEPFLIIRISPRFAMAGSQMDRIRNARDSASSFDLHDPFFEKTLPASGDDQSFTFGVRDSHIRFDIHFEVMLPDFQIGVLDLHGLLGQRFRAPGAQRRGFLANETRQHVCKVGPQLCQVNRLDSVPRFLQWGIARWKQPSEQLDMIFGANLLVKRNKVDPHAPADCLPIKTNPAEFGRSGAFVAIGRDDSNGDYTGVNKGEY